MRVLVLVKPAVEASELSFTEDMTIKRAGAAASVTMADFHAVSIARNLKRSAGAEFDILTVYPGYPSALISQLASYECRKIYHVSDPVLRGGDTLATARALCYAVKHISAEGGYDLILAGNASTDSETGQVPSELAAMLSLPVITHVLDVASDGAVIRLLEDRTDILRPAVPAVISICPKGTEPDPPSLIGKRAASSVDYVHLTAADIGCRPESVGFSGSGTRVRGVRNRVVKWRKAEITTDPEKGAEWIMSEVLKCREAVSGPEKGTRQEETPCREQNFVVVPSFDSEGGRASLEIISELAGLGKQPAAIMLGEKSDTAAAEQAGAYPAFSFDVPYTDDDSVYGKVLAGFLSGRNGTVFAPASIRMRSVIPYAAAILSSGLAADCTGFFFDGSDHPAAVRPAFEGSAEAEVELVGPQGFMTIRPHTFAVRDFGAFPGFEHIRMETDTWPENAVTCLESISDAAVGALNQSVILSIGAGVTDRKVRDELESFGCLMGASRTGVTRYALPYSWQVGLTGKIVHPDVYVAFGISGAAQHVSAISGAGMVISVNTDPKAPIIDFSDKAIIADVSDVVMAMDRIRRKRNGVQEDLLPQKRGI